MGPPHPHNGLALVRSLEPCWRGRLHLTPAGDVSKLSKDSWRGKDYVSGSEGVRLMGADIFTGGFECDTVCKIARFAGRRYLTVLHVYWQADKCSRNRSWVSMQDRSPEGWV